MCCWGLPRGPCGLTQVVVLHQLPRALVRSTLKPRAEIEARRTENAGYEAAEVVGRGRGGGYEVTFTSGVWLRRCGCHAVGRHRRMALAPQTVRLPTLSALLFDSGSMLVIRCTHMTQTTSSVVLCQP